MKMETPKMDVVRFNESDVIVASGLWTATVFNAGNAKEDIGLQVVDPNNKSTTFSYTQLANTEDANLLENKWFYKEEKSTNLLALVDDDRPEGAGALSAFDGTYTSTNGSHYYWAQ